MSYRRDADAAYLVAWPQHDVMKAGYSAHRRWRYFEIRGALVLGVWRFESIDEAFAAEDALDRCLRGLGGGRAFTSAAEAAPIIGNGGGGYLECITVPAAAIGHAAEHCYRALLDGAPEPRDAWLPEAKHVRTDGLTEKPLPLRNATIHSVPRHACTGNFDVRGGGTTRG